MHPFCSRITKVYEIYSHFDRFIASTIFVFLHILSGVFFLLSFFSFSFSSPWLRSRLLWLWILFSFHYLFVRFITFKCTFCIVICDILHRRERESKRERNVHCSILSQCVDCIHMFFRYRPCTRRLCVCVLRVWNFPACLTKVKWIKLKPLF